MFRRIALLLLLIPAFQIPNADAALPPLIPRTALLGGPERTLPRLSPDGTEISWLAPAKGVMNVWVKPLAGGEAKPVTNEPHRPIGWYAWAEDGRHILYLQDSDGDEIDHLYSADRTGGVVRDLTPWRGIRAQNVLTSATHPNEVLVALNLRDRRMFDMYRIDLTSGAVTLEAENPGDVLTWNVDSQFVVRAATAFDPKTLETVIRVRDAAGKPWRDLVVMPFERALFAGQVVGGSLVAGFSPDGKSLLVNSALHSDKGRIVRVDVQSGAELEVVAADPESDVAENGFEARPMVIADSSTGALQAVAFEKEIPHWLFIDKAMADDFKRIGQSAPGFLRLLSRDRADRNWIVVASRSDAPNAYFTYDRKTRVVTKLFSDCEALANYALAPKKVLTIKSHDGLSLVSYLTLPPGVEPKKLPLVLDIHGGPWIRDHADFDPEVQLLANRGYAVLQVNYRGSTGLGLAFLNASTNQWGRGTQQDLYEAVQSMIDRGIADPKRIAALGWSGGGYATLRALEMRPDLFVCGVDGVGPVDIATLFNSLPPYWSAITERWRRRVGDVEHDAELNRAISPLFHVDEIRSPLLIGQGKNDPRVVIRQADSMVKALRDRGREVTYVVYPDEGHGFVRPENNLDWYGRVEAFLATRLGGRAEPWLQVPGSSAEVR